jgi:hypothetical protein
VYNPEKGRWVELGALDVMQVFYSYSLRLEYVNRRCHADVGTSWSTAVRHEGHGYSHHESHGTAVLPFVDESTGNVAHVEVVNASSFAVADREPDDRAIGRYAQR